MVQELSPDQKGQASRVLGDIIVRTRNNFPDARFWPEVFLDTPEYHLYGLRTRRHHFWTTADGIGTKPELAERLYSATNNPIYFQSLAFDTFAMIDGDESRFGRFLLGIVQIIDTSKANLDMILALEEGAEQACNQGRFALLNGETAELGYRVGGYGNTRLNWNAVGISLVNRRKLILGRKLKPNQPIIAVREKSIRSNGLTLARKILEDNYLLSRGFSSRNGYFSKLWATFLEEELIKEFDLKGKIDEQMIERAAAKFDTALGVKTFEQLLVPWHEQYPDITRELLKPSMLYGPLMYRLQGGVDGDKEVEIIAASHISGGGVPEKIRRMTQVKGLGAYIEQVFPDPEGIRMLMEMPNSVGDREACQTWNRGIGFAMVARNLEDADRIVQIADQLGYEAAMAGKILQEPKIEFRGHTWTY